MTSLDCCEEARQPRCKAPGNCEPAPCGATWCLQAPLPALRGCPRLSGRTSAAPDIFAGTRAKTHESARTRTLQRTCRAQQHRRRDPCRVRTGARQLGCDRGRLRAAHPARPSPRLARSTAAPFGNAPMPQQIYALPLAAGVFTGAGVVRADAQSRAWPVARERPTAARCSALGKQTAQDSVTRTRWHRRVGTDSTSRASASGLGMRIDGSRGRRVMQCLRSSEHDS